MSPDFRSLFLFTKQEVDAAFSNARAVKKIMGLTLLKAGEDPAHRMSFGRLLIITPRAAGKANKRNLFRRRVKSIFYTHRLFEQPYTWILCVYRQAIDLSFEQLQEFMLKYLRPKEQKPSEKV